MSDFLPFGVLCQLAEKPDWAFMREKHDKIAFLFGEDDHWGPLQMCEDVSIGIIIVTLTL